MSKKIQRELSLILVLGILVGAVLIALPGCRSTSIGNTTTKTRVDAPVDVRGLAEALQTIPEYDRGRVADQIFQSLLRSRLVQIESASTLYGNDISVLQTKEVPFDFFRGAKTAVMPGATADGETTVTAPTETGTVQKAVLPAKPAVDATEATPAVLPAAETPPAE